MLRRWMDGGLVVLVLVAVLVFVMVAAMSVTVRGEVVEHHQKSGGIEKSEDRTHTYAQGESAGARKRYGHETSLYT